MSAPLFPRWKDVPEVASTSSALTDLSQKYAALANSGKSENRSEALKLWTKAAGAWWDALFALLRACTEDMPEQLSFDEPERLFIDFGCPGAPGSLLPAHQDFKADRALNAHCGAGIFPTFALSDYIASCWAMITGAECPAPSIGLPPADRAKRLEEELQKLQDRRGAELSRIAAEHRDAAAEADRLIQDLNAFELTATKVEMRVPEYREAKEDLRASLSQDRFRYAEAESAMRLMISSAQKDAEKPLPLPDMEAFLALHEETRTTARKILYCQMDVRKVERRFKKVTDACSQFSDAMKRSELKEMVQRKREYMAVPGKIARCDTTPLCPSDAAPIDRAANLARLEAMCSMDMDMFAVPRIRMYGIPSVIFIPGQGLGAYDWQDHALLLPVFPNGGEDKSLSYALGAFRWDSDEERRLKNPYEHLKDNRNKSILAMAASFYKDYFLWMTKEKKGYRILPRETHKAFELMFAPRKEEL